MNIQAVKVIQDSDLSKESKSIGIMGALMNADPDVIIKGMVSIQDSIDSEKSEGETPKLTKPKDYTKTQSILHDMMTENTGIAMMDSGGSYGRAWQRNRMIQDFRLLPEITLDEPYNKHELPTIGKDLFHFLDSQLIYDAKMSAEFKRFCNLKEYKDESYYYAMEPFAEKIHTKSDYPEKPLMYNSYNGDSMLSGTIQYCIFCTEDQDYILLQIHGGCDVRGGYTDPKVFQCSEGFDMFLITQNELSGSCGCDGFNPYSDDCGYHWYETGNKEDIKKDWDFPKIWQWSNRLKGIYCRECKKEVNFS